MCATHEAPQDLGLATVTTVGGRPPPFPPDKHSRTKFPEHATESAMCLHWRTGFLPVALTGAARIIIVVS